MRDTLPIDEVLDDLTGALRRSGQAVLQAPPGAGKTTRVPLAILEAGLGDGRIVMLEPRRLAARAAAERMAETLGQTVGATVGYRIRGETKTSSRTRIEVVTEGILTRMIQSDPGLTGIGTVIFDEFHERSLNADLGLTLALEVREALRDDLRLVVMSATLDAEPVARLMGNAPVITSEGRAFPVETRWRDRPLPRDRTRPSTIAADIAAAMDKTDGGVLVFLPGEGEIRRVATALEGRLSKEAQVLPLFGAMKISDQRAAIQPLSGGRKVVLATSIAETSLTIEDVRVVIDTGEARRARFDPGSGMSRLVTERVTRAEADQRRGRAGRVAPGVCYRLWTKGEDGAMAAYPPAEIEAADLAGLALELALWGAGDASGLSFPTPPLEAALAEARALLAGLGVLDAEGRITEHGRTLAAMPLHPRLAHMLAKAGRDAAPLAALLSDRDPFPRGSSDLGPRITAIRGGRAPEGVNPGALARIRDDARRLERLAPKTTKLNPAQAAALAYPDRIALRRPGDVPRWLLSGGKGARMDEADALAGTRLLVVTDTDGHPTEAMIRQAIPISEAELREVSGDDIRWIGVAEWSKRTRKVEARWQERLGSLVLKDQIWRDAPEEAISRAMLDGVRDLGLRPSPAVERLRTRVALLRENGMELPDLSDEALLEHLEVWLLPYLGGIRTASAWENFDILDALRAYLGWDACREIDTRAPAKFTTPLGREVPIDYATGAPTIEVRLQEMFGVTTHPVAAGQAVRVTLLSPAGRPVQTTTDLPGFWATSYADVRKDMRGRYPKHPWPEDPKAAEPTLRAKRRD